PIRCVQTSAAAGWSKPAAGFFDAAARTAQTPPERILFVGDDLRNDYDGARAAGFAAILLDVHGRCARADVPRIGGPAEALRWRPRLAYPGPGSGGRGAIPMSSAPHSALRVPSLRGFRETRRRWR